MAETIEPALEAALIFVDAPHRNTFEVRRGQWLVADLKRAIGVDAHKMLARIDPFGLTDLDDREHIDVRDGERFMSHVRQGGSS